MQYRVCSDDFTHGIRPTNAHEHTPLLWYAHWSVHATNDDDDDDDDDDSPVGRGADCRRWSIGPGAVPRHSMQRTKDVEWVQRVQHRQR